MLSGFYVTVELDVVEVSVHTWPGWVPARQLEDEIRAALEELMADGAEQTAELLQGRTFARVVHSAESLAPTCRLTLRLCAAPSLCSSSPPVWGVTKTDFTRIP